jgi:hypothetical protein
VIAALETNGWKGKEIRARRTKSTMFSGKNIYLAKLEFVKDHEFGMKKCLLSRIFQTFTKRINCQTWEIICQKLGKQFPGGKFITYLVLED